MFLTTVAGLTRPSRSSTAGCRKSAQLPGWRRIELRRQSSVAAAQRLHTSILPYHERVFDPHAELPIGIVESRLDRDDVADLDLVAVRRGQSEEWLLVHVQSDSVAEGVDVAFECGGVGAGRRVTVVCEEIADEGLVRRR